MGLEAKVLHDIRITADELRTWRQILGRNGCFLMKVSSAVLERLAEPGRLPSADSLAGGWLRALGLSLERGLDLGPRSLPISSFKAATRADSLATLGFQFGDARLVASVHFAQRTSMSPMLTTSLVTSSAGMEFFFTIPSVV